MATSSHRFSDVNDVHCGFFVRHFVWIRKECRFKVQGKIARWSLYLRAATGPGRRVLLFPFRAPRRDGTLVWVRGLWSRAVHVPGALGSSDALRSGERVAIGLPMMPPTHRLRQRQAHPTATLC